MRRKSILSDQESRTRLVWVLVVFLLIMMGIWVLSLLNVIGVAWSMLLEAIFTGLGSILALLQWYQQATSETPCAAGLSSSGKADLREPILLRLANKRKGAIVVYTPRAWRGTTLHLVPGLQGTIRPIEAVSSVIEKRIAGQRLFLCHFPTVPPGHYTLVAVSKQRQVQVTVYPGHLSEVDWR